MTSLHFRPPKPVRMTLNLAPMVDVMMCLIIFFLLASRLVRAERHPLELPEARTSEQMTRGAPGSRVVVNVRPGADGGAPSYIVSQWDGAQIRDRRLERAELADYLRSAADDAAGGASDIRCVIRADRETPYVDVEAVLKACGLAQVGQVVFSTRTTPETESEP